MPTLYLADFSGNVAVEEAADEGAHFRVAAGPHAGTYPKVREGHLTHGEVFTSWEAAREAAVDILGRAITRAERDVELLKRKKQKLEGAATPDEQPGGWPFSTTAPEG